MADENDETVVDSSILAEALEKLGLALREVTNKAKFSDAHGVNIAPLDCHDLAITAEGIAAKISSFDWSTVEDANEYFSDLSPKVIWAKDNLAPNIHSGPGAVNALLGLLFSVEMQMMSLVSPEAIAKSQLLPSELRRNVLRTQRTLDGATEALGDVESKLKAINTAHDAARNLPATQADLEQALKDVETSRSTVLRLETEAKQLTASSTETKAHLDDLVKRADETMARVDHAYRAATSDGLARSFADKAQKLNRSMYMWAVALVAALAGAVWLGFERFPAILLAIKPVPNAPLNWGALAVHGLISVLSLGPAIWLAWIATKQIGQRFRLAEDYAYKAALSAAYEGYRTEAVGIDELMKAQLFSIALTRLDEIPLRVVDHDVPGSPMHELLKSQEFRDALDQSPALYERVISILRRGGKQSLPVVGQDEIKSK